MEIKNISEKIFKTVPNKIQENSAQTNPFGISFKRSIISADVFETAQKINPVKNLADKASDKSRMVVSAIVGSIGNMTSAISTRLDSVVSFGKRIGTKAKKAWKFVKENNLQITFDIVKKQSQKAWLEMDFFDSTYKTGNLLKLDTAKLGDMLSETIAERAA